MVASESESQPYAYVLAEHRLVGEYVLQILHRDRRIHSVLCEQFPSRLSTRRMVIFIIDTGCLSLSLGECLRRLENRFPTCKVLILTRPQGKTECAIALRQGIQGIVAHNMVSSTLLEAVRAVARGELWVTDEVIQSCLATTGKRQSPCSERIVQPTPREAEIIELVKQRLSNKEIGSILGVQESTVKYHLSNVFGKFQVGSRHQLLNSSRRHWLWDNQDNESSDIHGVHDRYGLSKVLARR